jgi:hypothetical protein
LFVHKNNRKNIFIKNIFIIVIVKNRANLSQAAKTFENRDQNLWLDSRAASFFCGDFVCVAQPPQHLCLANGANATNNVVPAMAQNLFSKLCEQREESGFIFEKIVFLMFSGFEF